MTNHCISHIKDVDGISSAALVFAAMGGTFALTDYDEVFKQLDSVPEGADSLVLCDLGTDATKFDSFAEKLVELSRRMKVTYIDHHYLAPEAREKLASLPIRLVHDTGECAAMLTYQAFRESLPAEAAHLALYGAVTDYMDSSPVATKMMERFDRQYVLLECTMLSYAIANNRGEYAYLEKLVTELAAMRVPHSIERLSDMALRQLDVVTALAGEVHEKGVQLGKLAYMETEESSTGNVAKLLLGAFDVVVGASYKKKEKVRAEVSLRATSGCRVHLGQAISSIAARHGGNGGGHQKAAGCSIPWDSVLTVFTELSEVV